MNFERIIAKLLRMDEKTWRKHSNPWSGYTRLPLLIPLTLALWSRVWIGWWAIVPVIAVLAWIWLNPRIFPEPKSTDNWFSKGVFGEWIWVNRDKIEILKHHRRVPRMLSIVAAMGLVPYIWGIVILEPWPTVLGMILMFTGKLWFVDRMVWLYEDMKDRIQLSAS